MNSSKTNIKIFAFSGKMGSGKDFLAEAARKMLPTGRKCISIALADHFKIDVIAKDGIEYERVYIEKDENSRDLLQKRGTEQGRLVYGPNIWVDTLLTWIRVHIDRDIDTFFVTDVRFPNEVELLRTFCLAHGHMFICIRVESPNRTHERLTKESRGNNDHFEKLKSHVSETALDTFPLEKFDLVVNNDVGDDPLSSIRNILLDQVTYERILFLDLDDTLCECSKYYEEIIALCANKVKETYGSEKKKEFIEHFDKHGRNFEKKTFKREDFAEMLVSSLKSVVSAQPDMSNIFYNLGLSVYDKEFAPFPGARETVLQLEKYFDHIIIFTIGSRVDQMRKLYNLGLQHLTMETFIHKDYTIFKTMMSEYHSKHYTMVGDSLERDVKPAILANIDQIYHISSQDHVYDSENVKRISNIGELLTLVEKNQS